jgi:hypothetical protein
MGGHCDSVGNDTGVKTCRTLSIWLNRRNLVDSLWLRKLPAAHLDDGAEGADRRGELHEQRVGNRGGASTWAHAATAIQVALARASSSGRCAWNDIAFAPVMFEPAREEQSRRNARAPTIEYQYNTGSIGAVNAELRDSPADPVRLQRANNQGKKKLWAAHGCLGPFILRQTCEAKRKSKQKIQNRRLLGNNPIAGR